MIAAVHTDLKYYNYANPGCYFGFLLHMHTGKVDFSYNKVEAKGTGTVAHPKLRGAEVHNAIWKRWARRALRSEGQRGLPLPSACWVSSWW